MKIAATKTVDIEATDQDTGEQAVYSILMDGDDAYRLMKSGRNRTTLAFDGDRILDVTINTSRHAPRLERIVTLEQFILGVRRNVRVERILDEPDYRRCNLMITE